MGRGRAVCGRSGILESWKTVASDTIPSRRKFYWFPWAISCRDVSFARRKRAQRGSSEAGGEGKRELKGGGAVQVGSAAGGSSTGAASL